MAKKTSRNARTKSPSTPSAPSRQSAALEPHLGLAHRGELAQLAEVRALYKPLSEEHAAAFLGLFSVDSCRERALATKADDVFRTAMGWVRAAKELVDKAGVNHLRIRWFLDCATALGYVLSTKHTTANPSADAAYRDVVKKTDQLYERTKRSLGFAAGDNAVQRAAVKTATASEGPDGRALVLRRMAELIKNWLPTGAVVLETQSIGTDTVAALEAAATEVEAATAKKPAAKQAGHDSPEANEAEGRLLTAMRPIWHDIAYAREDGSTRALLTVSPAILRGLSLRKGKNKDDDPEDEEEGPAEGTGTGQE